MVIHPHTLSNSNKLMSTRAMKQASFKNQRKGKNTLKKHDIILQQKPQ